MLPQKSVLLVMVPILYKTGSIIQGFGMSFVNAYKFYAKLLLATYFRMRKSENKFEKVAENGTKVMP